MDKKLKIILCIVSVCLIITGVIITYKLLYNKSNYQYTLPDKDKLFRNVISHYNYNKPIDIDKNYIYKREPVPKKVYRLWCVSEPEGICGGREAQKYPLYITKKSLADWEEIIYGDDDIDIFLEKEFGVDSMITKAYYLINPDYGAARADLVRHLVIYKYGGLYLDMKSFVKGELPELPSDKDMWISTWNRFLGKNPQQHLFPKTGEYQNWYIYARKGAPILKDIIEKIVNNIYMVYENPNINYDISQEKNSKGRVLSITGPIAMTIAINNSEHKDDIHYDNSINKVLNYSNTFIQQIGDGHYSKLTTPMIKTKCGVYIPKVIYMTYYDLSLVPKYVKDNIKKYCSGYELKLYDDDMCLDFLDKYYGEDATSIFNNMENGAHKADFWRYCILYLFGGYYFDIKTDFQIHIDKIFEIKEPKTWYTVIDETKRRIYNGIIVTPPQNPILLDVIQHIYNNPTPETYSFYIEYLFNTLSKNCKNTLVVGNNEQKHDWNCILFQEECTKDCQDKCDKYGVNCVIKNDKNKLLFNTRYTDFPWKYVTVKNYIKDPVSGYKIPQSIFQTHETNIVPLTMYNAIESLQKHAPSCSYTFYDNKERRTYIKENYPSALKAYDMLVPDAFKADLFRYIRLYIDGGIYFDSGFNTKGDITLLNDVIGKDDEFIASNDFNISNIAICNGFIASIPEHPILKEVINICIDNIFNRKYFGFDIGKTHGDLKITGPIALGEAVNSIGYKNKKGVKFFNHISPVIKNGDNIIYNTRYNDYDKYRVYFSNKDRYGELYLKRQVYKDIE